MTNMYEEGDKESPICIVSISSGRIEARQGQPLAGPHGQIFDQCLHMAKIVRKEVYILTIFNIEIKQDIKSTWIKDLDNEFLWTKKSGLTELGLVAIKPFLDRVNNCKANVLVPLGGPALDILFNDIRIMKWRGSVLPGSDLIDNRKIVPSLDPRQILKGKYLWRHLLVNDLSKAREQSFNREINIVKRTLIINPTFSEAIDYMHEAKKLYSFGSDIECLNHQVSCFCIAPSSLESMCIPLVVQGGRHRWSLEEEEAIWLLYASLLGDEKIMKINQNIIFDIGFLFSQMNIHTYGPIGDTMIAHHIMYPDFPKGLDFLCSMHTDIPYYKDDGKLWQKPWNDLELFWEYNARDGVAACAIWEEMDLLLDKDGYRQVYNDTIDLFPSLLYMMNRGIAVDRKELEITKEQVKSEIIQKEKYLIEVSDYPFSPTSPKQCQEYFYVNKGIKPYVNRSTGRPTTDDKAMSRIYRRYHFKEAKVVQELRSLHKLLGTYLEVGIDSDDRIRSSYNPRGTTTGRLSNSQTIFGTGMNMQNLHPEFKTFLIARE